MPKNARCCVGGCDNDKRYSDLWVIRSHVSALKWHQFPSNNDKFTVWKLLISKGRDNFVPGSGTYVCSNHFPDGRPTKEHPNPTWFLTPTECLSATPKKAKKRHARPEYRPQGSEIPAEDETMDLCESVSSIQIPDPVPMFFEHLGKKADVRFFTGFSSPEHFHAVFSLVVEKARMMVYWEGPKYTKAPSVQNSASTLEGMELTKKKPGPSRKLSLTQEFLMTMMKLRLGLLNDDLAFRFRISSRKFPVLQ